MTDSKKYIEEDKISFKILVRNARDWILSLWGRKFTILIGAVLIAILALTYDYIKKTVFSAQTTFVLETSEAAGLGQLSSIASLAGVNIGGLAEGSDLFQIDNIMELYRSHRMIEKTLLTKAEFESGDELLINRYAEDKKLRKKWNKIGYLNGINFDIPRDQFTIRHDSILIEVVKDIREKTLFVSKPSRKLTILSVVVSDSDEHWAKKFNEAIVENVNHFYLETKTKKNRLNLNILQRQTDSVKMILDDSMLAMAKLSEGRSNLNPLFITSQVPFQKLNIDIQTSGAAYAEMIKNLEIAKIAERNSTPLIQIIDRPILPLQDNKWKTLKTIVFGGFFGGVFMIVFLTTRNILVSALKD